MKKQMICSAIIMLFFVGMFSVAVPTSFAIHVADVHWADIHAKYPQSKQVLVDNKTISTQWQDLYTIFSPSPRAHITGSQLCPLVFIVNNTIVGGDPSATDPITTVEVSIPQDGDGYSYFYLNETRVTEDNLVNPVPGWSSETIESDPNREIRSFRFTSADGVQVGSTLAFWMFFRGGPEFCTYEFTVWTHDEGSISGTKRSYRHDLKVVMDNFPPVFTSLEARPVSGETFQGLPLVNGDPRPSGKHIVTAYVNASDYINCSSGIIGAHYEMRLINFSTGAEYWFKNETWEYPFGNVNGPITSEPWVYSKEIWSNNTRNSLAEGKYNLTVRIWDRVGNSAEKTYSFYYRPPPIPAYYAAPETNIVNSVTGLVESKQVVYKTKTLGSTVDIRSWNITGFKVGNTPTVRIYIPTYEWYNSTYGTFNVLVNNTAPVDSNGYPTGTFIFPKAPQGTYTVYIAGLDPNSLSLTKYQNVAVIPQIIFNPNEIIGPAAIDVMATGSLKPAVEQPAFATYLLIRESTWEHPKDALMGMNNHVWQNWYIDFNGTLQNWITRLTGVEVAPGFLMPISQPGTYHITLLIQAQFYYWQCIEWLPRTQMSHSNTITVEETLSLLIDINAKLQELKPIVERIDGNVVTINTTAGLIEAKIDQLSPVITRIDGNVVTINTIVGQINTTMATFNLTTISGNIVEIKTSVGTDLSGKVASIKDDVATITTDVGEVKTQVPSLTTPIYIAVVFSIIAAIAAIACAFLVFRKIA